VIIKWGVVKTEAGRDEMIRETSLGKFVEAVRLFKEWSAKAEFAQFWEVVLARLSEHLRPDSEAYKEEVRASLRAIIELLEEGKLPEEEAERYREKILGAALFELKEEELPGSSEDPSTPLGFYKYLSPIRQEERGFKIYAPYALSIFETSLQGVGVILPFVKNVHPEISKSTLEGLKETAEGIYADLGLERLRALRGMAIEGADELLLNSPFLAFIHPQNFYQEGRRFYGQGEMDYYKCGVTSGFIIPEDYYGREVYETFGPGITQEKGLEPGSFADISIGENRKWHELVLKALLGKAGQAEIEINPYRPIYFDSALYRIKAKGGRFKNLIDVEYTGQQLRENAERWAKRGKLEEYKQDAANILAYFLSQEYVDVYLVRSFDSAWRGNLPQDGPAAELFAKAPLAAPYLTSLLSDRVCVYTSRGELSKINRGFWVNPPVLDWLEPSTEYAWELIPYYLLGLPSEEVRELLQGAGRKYWLKRFIHDPTRAIFNEENRVKREDQDLGKLAWRIVEELLRPDISRLTRPPTREFLTLRELTPIFGRSYGRLRHWIREFNLGAYSIQAYDHRFTKESLRAFVERELRGKKGFNQAKVEEILRRIEEGFEAEASQRGINYQCKPEKGG
jgi:hypothetical protein